MLGFLFVHKYIIITMAASGKVVENYVCIFLSYQLKFALS
jgi:hypothetical protein